MRHYTAHRAGLNFRRYDEAALKELAAKRGNANDYISSVREKIAEQEALLRKDLHHDPSHSDHAWDSEQMRDAANRP